MFQIELSDHVSYESFTREAMLDEITFKLIKIATTLSLEVGYKGDSSIIFIGSVAQAITKKFIDSESIFYCVTGKLELGKKIAIALGTDSVLKSILWEIDKKLCEMYSISPEKGTFIILQNTEVFGDYLNKIYTKGYVMVDRIKEYYKSNQKVLSKYRMGV